VIKVIIEVDGYFHQVLLTGKKVFQKGIKTKINIMDTLLTLEGEALNQALKTILNRVTYKRIIPEDILKLSTRNPARKFYPFEIEIEYI